MDNYSLFGYALIIGTVVIMFLRYYYFNLIGKLMNNECIAYWQLGFMKLYSISTYLWIGFAIIAQYFKAVPLYLDIIKNIPTDRMVNSTEIDAAHKLINSALLLNSWVFLGGLVIYTWYVLYGVFRKDKELRKYLEK